ncbi:MAG: nitrate/nitrite transporter NrtS [Sedimentitalea sp.]
MSADPRSFWVIATDRSVMVRAARISAVVGVILAMINHGEHVMSGNVTGKTWFKIALTFAVPYCVSTYSSVLAVRERLQNLLDP